MADPEALKSVFSTNTSWAEWSTIAVFVGLVIDIFVILGFDLRDPNKSWWEIGLGFVGAIVIATGVLGEWKFGHRATEAASQLQAVLERQTSAANERAAKAEKAAEDERKARLEFEKLYGPRRFTREQRARLVQYWHKYAGTPVKIGVYFDPESAAFSDEILLMLREAGLKVEQSAVSGIGMGVAIQGPWTDLAMMDDFSNSLNCEGIFALHMETCGEPPCFKGTPTGHQTCDFKIDIFFRPLGSLEKSSETKCVKPWSPPTVRCAS